MSIGYYKWGVVKDRLKIWQFGLVIETTHPAVIMWFGPWAIMLGRVLVIKRNLDLTTFTTEAQANRCLDDIAKAKRDITENTGWPMF